ncbi:hypothetical protein JCM8097_006883 [Rhodosporidiobolus ruineniae]
MSNIARNANIGLDLSGKTAAVSGGTQGIGAAVAVRFAQAGSNVFVIGRNEELGRQVIEKMRNSGEAAQGRNFEFIQADLSSVQGVKKVADTLKEKAGSKGIDFLVETQGGPPNGSTVMTNSTPAHDAHFAVTIFSRFSLAYLLAKQGTLKQSWVNVTAPGGTDGPEPNLADIELTGEEHKKKSFVGRMTAQMQQTGALGDAMVAQFPREFPHLRASHLFPGVVATNAIESAHILPGPLAYLASSAFSLLARFTPFVQLPAFYAEIPVYVAANPEAQGKGLEFANEKLKAVGRPKWADGEGNVAEKAWGQLKEMMEKEL